MSVVVIGDVHGCLGELNRLLSLAWNGTDRLILLGDLIDRGPDPLGVVRYVRQLGAECVLGNHEEKALRWHDHEATRGLKKNPIRVADSRRLEWISLSGEDLDWLRQLPTCISFGEWLAVHAGFEPALSLSEQRPDKVIRVRYVGDDDRMAGFEEDSMAQPPNSRHWAERWHGPQNVVYGHSVHSLSAPRVDHHGAFSCHGIDTGCVFGGRLTAAVIDGNRVDYVSVPAERAHYSLELREARPAKAAPRVNGAPDGPVLAIGGKDVMEALGIAPGPAVGAELRRLLDIVTERPELNTREALLAELASRS